LAKEYHPDKNPKNADHFKAINEAYYVLKDQHKREDYDLGMENWTKGQTHYHRDFHYGRTKKDK
jgi:curved DNA-binding protein CbpA